MKHIPWGFVIFVTVALAAIYGLSRRQLLREANSFVLRFPPSSVAIAPVRGE